MLTSLLYFVAGTFLGWNLPQPEWAANLQKKVIDFFKK